MTQIPDENLIRRVIDCAIAVHSQIGTGFDKDIYETCMTMELGKAGLAFECGRVLTFVYRGHLLDYQCPADIIVADALLLQIEAVDELELVHEQRLRSCLYMGGFSVGLMMNFNAVEMAEGITRMAGAAGHGQTDPEIRDVFDDPDFDFTDPSLRTP
jgi:GxxExxY protein